MAVSVSALEKAASLACFLIALRVSQAKTAYAIVTYTMTHSGRLQRGRGFSAAASFSQQGFSWVHGFKIGVSMATCVGGTIAADWLGTFLAVWEPLCCFSAMLGHPNRNAPYTAIIANRFNIIP
jgi:hypothetical protein